MKKYRIHVTFDIETYNLATAARYADQFITAHEFRESEAVPDAERNEATRIAWTRAIRLIELVEDDA